MSPSPFLPFSPAPSVPFTPTPLSPARARGFTLVEVLVATALSLVLMAAVASVLGSVGKGINSARSALESGDRLRAAQALLRTDLSGVTARMFPSRKPETEDGYFEYIEGPHLHVAMDRTRTPSVPDYTAGQRDDILMFTTRSSSRPFQGRYYRNRYQGTTQTPVLEDSTLESFVAEVAWFVRGRTLHRRVLLVVPGTVLNVDLPNAQPKQGATASDRMLFYAKNDISAHWEVVGNNARLVANSLGSLTKRENRFAHRTAPSEFGTIGFPFDVTGYWGPLGLPTIRECSTPAAWSTSTPWTSGSLPAPALSPPIWGADEVDLWSNIPLAPAGVQDAGRWYPDNYLNPDSNGSDPLRPKTDDPLYTRIADDIVLTNVIAFDVKAWDSGAPVYSKEVRIENTTQVVVVKPGDPGYESVDNTWTLVGYGAFVDLGYERVAYPPPVSVPAKQFNHLGDPKSQLAGSLQRGKTYDTWSFHYENEGLDAGNRAGAGLSTDGFVDNASGIPDAPLEQIAPPPYPTPLRGIQVKIRTFEPDSRAIREVTIEQDFLPR